MAVAELKEQLEGLRSELVNSNNLSDSLKHDLEQVREKERERDSDSGWGEGEGGGGGIQCMYTNGYLLILCDDTCKFD